MKPAEFVKRRALIAHAAGKSKRWRERAMYHLVREASAVEVMANNQLVGWRLLGGQIVCVKQRYRNEDEAVYYMHMIRACGASDSKPARAYHCPHCSGWHLTSRA